MTSGRIVIKDELLGDIYVEYLATEVEKPTDIIFYISGIGLDRTDFKEHLGGYDN